MLGRGPSRFALLCAALAAGAPGFAAAAPAGALPNQSYPSSLEYTIISPQMGREAHNQPHAVNGYLLLAGNARFTLWDISDPFHPAEVSRFESPYRFGEAESHQVTFSRLPDGTLRAATISGRGIDLWDLTDPRAPAPLASMLLEGVNYGDKTNAVWGVFWQGRYVYVGGTNTGLHVVDASDPRAPRLVARVPTSAFGDVSAGPLFAVGNLLVVTTPKDSAGVATFDIGDPAAPRLLDFVKPERASYIGGMYGALAYLITPLRAYDVTTDPADIRLVASTETAPAEYVSFGDGFLFLGALRPAPGVFKYDLADVANPALLGKVAGRLGLNVDDQFSVPIGNLLAMSDDQERLGSVLAVHDDKRDTTPPTVLYANPANGATRQPLTTRVGLSFSDQIDLTTVDASTVILRPPGGAPLSGMWGLVHTHVSFWPDAPLAPNTTYEIVVPAGGVTDLVGNAVPQTFRSVFSTGEGVDAAPCAIAPLAPATPGEAAAFQAEGLAGGDLVRWDFGDGAGTPPSESPHAAHAYAAPGRYAVTLTVTRQELSASCSATQIVHLPLTAGRPTRSGGVAVDEARGRVWVVNPDADTVAAVDMGTLAKLFETETGADPRTLALAPDRSVWVAAHDAHEITILDGETGAVADRIALPYASRPYGVAFSPDGAAAYVTLEATGTLLALDPEARAVVGNVSFGPDAAGLVPSVRGVAVAEDSARVLVTRFVSPEDRAEVYEVDAASLAVLGAIPLATDPGPDTPDGGRGVPNYLSSIAISPDGASAWIPSKKDNVLRGLARDGLPLTHDNAVRTVLSRIDLAARAEDLAARVDLNDHDMAFAAEPSPLGDLVFVASQGTNQIDVLDAYDGSTIAGFAAGLAPQALALSADGALYVQNFMSRTLGAYDVSAILAARDGAAFPLGEVSTVAKEKLAPTVLLGKQIFYNADTSRMNSEGYISCASCHLDGGQDGRVWDFTDRGEGVRNTITLRGRAGMGHGPVHWTGNFDEIQDFENDIRLHFGGAGFMDDAKFEAGSRADPLGDPKKGLSKDLDALAAYVASLDAAPPSPYRAPDGSLTAEAEAGRGVFERLDCAGCHAGARFTDSALGVLHDVGTLKPSSGFRRGEALTGLDTPTLKGLWESAPYLHDGSAATLHEVLDNPLHGNAASLAAGEKDQLVAYLLQLDDLREPRRLEAEDAALEGGVEARADHPGYSGTGYADYPGAYSGAVRLRWTFAVKPADGRNHLTLRYANGSAWPRLLQVRVNGRALALPAVFAPTGAWDAWETTVVPNVNLPDGPVTLELVARDSAGPNLDYAELAAPEPPACGYGPELPLLLAPFLWRRRRLRRAARRGLASRDWTSPPPP